jgi:hypothetical protein
MIERLKEEPMLRIILFFTVLVLAVGSLKANESTAQKSFPTQVDTPATPLVYTPAALPTPNPAPIVAPTWAPEKAGNFPDNPAPHKSSPWMSSIGLGIGIPMSRNLNKAYAPGFNFNLGSGYKITGQFSLWFDLNVALYSSKSNTLTGGNNYTMIGATFLARYRFLESDLSPYLFTGPGLAYNENRSNGVLQYNPATGYAYVPINAYEFDLLAEGGLGLGIRLGGGSEAFLQGKWTYDFTSPHFAGFASTDSPIIVMPLEMGLLFGL